MAEIIERTIVQDMVVEAIELIKLAESIPFETYLYGIASRDQRRRLRILSSSLIPFAQDVYINTEQIAREFGIEN